MNLIKKSFSLEGHQTSVALEPEFWEALKSHAKENQMSLSALISKVDIERGERPLASSLRVFCLRVK